MPYRGMSCHLYDAVVPLFFKHLPQKDGGCPVAEEALSTYTAFQRAGQALLEQAASQAQEAGLAPETCVVESGGHSTSQALVEAAKRWSADLIVLGTHGRRGLHHLVLGSVAEGVVRLAPVPVLLVRLP